jgi:serine phosphatase RsbU (regulator of sigma subunit)
VHFLRRGLSAAFNVGEAQVWFSPPHENLLRLIGHSEASSNGDFWSSSQITTSADRLEARAFRQRVPLRGREAEGQIVRAIPLMIPGRQPIGVVTIFDDLLEELYSEQRERDLQLVGFLNQAARALQAVNLRRQELVFAGRVQSSLLPELPVDLPGWQIAAAWKPARETSGDFYDFVPLPDGRLGLVIADVVDKGMGAALLMALTRTVIRTYAGKYPDRPEELLRETNQRMIADLHSGPFVTLFYGILDPETSQMVYSNAGHPPPYLFAPDSSPAAALQTLGMPLGIASDSSWKSASVQILPGALLLLYTDGVIEAHDPSGELFGFRRMVDAVQSQLGQPVSVIQDSLMSGVFAFAGSGPQSDDITLMLVGRET